MPRTITVVENVYYRLTGNPDARSWQFVHSVESEEPAYNIKVKISADWTPLDSGHLAECSHLLLINEGADKRTLRPTHEQLMADAALILEVGILSPDGKTIDVIGPIPPQQSWRFSPDLARVRLRCLAGVTNVSSNVYPR